MTQNVDYKRNLLIVPVGKSNQIAKKNYERTVLDPSLKIHWATRSDQMKTSKIWEDLCVGDVVVFIYGKKTKVAGIVTHTYQDNTCHTSLGWLDAEGFDLIIEMTKVELVEPEILQLLNYTSTPCGMAICCKKKAIKFWDKFSTNLPLDPSALRHSMNSIVDRSKTSVELFKEEARALTEMNWHRYQSEINPTGLERGQAWHLDHRFSLAAAFDIGMPAWLVADPVNLQLISGSENLSKGSKCGSIEPLINKHPEFSYLKETYEARIRGGIASWIR